jgi:hypothetical protein
VTYQMPPTNELIDQLTGSLSPEGRKILERVEALAPTGEAAPIDPEAAVALIESLPDEDRMAVYRIMGLRAQAYQQRGEEYADEVRLASQAVGLIDHALTLERAAGREPAEGMTLGEALEVLKAHGKELPDLDAQRWVDVLREGERAVPAFYPEFTNVGQFRRWDGSEQAEAWARLMESRETAILASVGDLVGMGIEGADYTGVIALLWNLDEDEAAEFVRQRQGGSR